LFLFGSILAVTSLTSISDALAQATQPARSPASAAAEPPYSKALQVPEDMLDRPPRQVMVLPSEPGEYGEDPMQLSSGVIGKLPPEVHRLPEGHVVAGLPVSIEHQGEWMVCYLADERLLTVSGSEAGGWAADLDARRVPQGLVRLSQEKGVPLAPEAVVTVEDAKRRWRVVDPRRAVIVEADRAGLAVRAALPIRVLPNKRLMMLEAIIASSDKPPVFAITGRITEFQGVNYVLLEHLSEVVDVQAKPQAVESKPAGTNGQAPASAPAGREVRPEDIIQQLLQSKPRRAVVLPQSMPAAEPESTAGPVAEGDVPAGQRVWPEETMLVDRPGRVIPSEKGWTFVFEDKGNAVARKPIRLLPNRMLETAVAVGGDKTLGVVLVVSGEVTEYRGNNYLLLRKVLVQRDMGNLR
jgi:hypothetical protein